MLLNRKHLLSFSSIRSRVTERSKKQNNDSEFGLGELVSDGTTFLTVAEEWKENFRMGKDNFYKLCGELRQFIERKITNMRLPVFRSNQKHFFGLT